MPRKATVERDDENQEWVVRIPFQEYYGVAEACRIVLRARSTVSGLIDSGQIAAVCRGKVRYATHQGIIDYLASRAERERRAQLAPVPFQPKATKSRKKPRPPKAIVPSATAEEWIERGELDFLAGLRPVADGLQ